MWGKFELIVKCGSVVPMKTDIFFSIRSDEGLTLETSALYSLRWPIYIFNLVDITKLPCCPHRRNTTVSLETFTLYIFLTVDLTDLIMQSDDEFFMKT